jgi:hypothetical protein
LNSCESCGSLLDTDFGIVLCSQCGYQNFLQGDLGSQGSFEEPFSQDSFSEDQFSQENLSQESLSENPLSQENLSQNSFLKDSFSEESFSKDSSLEEESGQELEQELKKASVKELEEGLEQKWQEELGGSLVKTPDQKSQSFVSEVVEFGNTSSRSTSAFLYVMIIKEINLSDEKKVVLETLRKHHVEENQIQPAWGEGEVRVTQLSAAKIARIKRDLGNYDVETDVIPL